MTLPLEHVDSSTPIGRNFAVIGQRAVSLGGSVQADLRIGVATVTWDGAHASTSATVTHGLGRAPVVALVTAEGGSFPLAEVVASSIGSTTFSIGVTTPDGSFPAAASTRRMFWTVIG